MDKRYCQRCGTSVLVGTEHLAPCRTCGGTNYDARPLRIHDVRRWRLSENDRNFLRTQGIDPEED